jgi:hypothetical protein
LIKLGKPAFKLSILRSFDYSSLLVWPSSNYRTNLLNINHSNAGFNAWWNKLGTGATECQTINGLKKVSVTLSKKNEDRNEDRIILGQGSLLIPYWTNVLVPGELA